MILNKKLFKYIQIDNENNLKNDNDKNTIKEYLSLN